MIRDLAYLAASAGEALCAAVARALEPSYPEPVDLGPVTPPPPTLPGGRPRDLPYTIKDLEAMRRGIRYQERFASSDDATFPIYAAEATPELLEVVANAFHEAIFHGQPRFADAKPEVRQRFYDLARANICTPDDERTSELAHAGYGDPADIIDDERTRFADHVASVRKLTQEEGIALCKFPSGHSGPCSFATVEEQPATVTLCPTPSGPEEPVELWCTALQPDYLVRPGEHPYRCTRPEHHPGAHSAAIDGSDDVAVWPR